jgi:predicted metal-binding protein
MDRSGLTIEQRIEKAENLAPVESEVPAEEFLDFFEESGDELAQMLSLIKAGTDKLRDFALRAGMLPPGQVVVDEQIKELCKLPYRTPKGMIEECPGITRGFTGCPPFAPSVETTRGLLSASRSLLVLQFAGNENSAPQGDVHSLLAKVTAGLQEKGYRIIETYASGPCRVCPKGCGDSPECRLPDRRMFAFEACGFWVNTVCREAAKFPLLGGGPAVVRWVKNWRLATQDTGEVTYTTGFLLG